MIKTPQQIAQWVIDNRFPKSENDKTTDLEMFYFVKEAIEAYHNQFESAKDKLILAQKEYITLLSNEIDRTATFLKVHGSICSDEVVKRGIELRKIISELPPNPTI